MGRHMGLALLFVGVLGWCGVPAAGAASSVTVSGSPSPAVSDAQLTREQTLSQIELAQAPQHFLHIDRIGAAPNGEPTLTAGHAFELPMIRSCGS